LKTILNYRNNLLMMYKNLLKHKHRNRILYFRMILDGVSAVHSLLQGDVSVLKAVWKAHKSYRKLRRIYHLNLIPDSSPQVKGAPLSYPSCVYRHSVVYQYFIKGRKTFDLIQDF